MTESLTHRVAAEVRAEMARQRVSQRKVGEVLGKSQPQISARLRGEIPFDTAELEQLAQTWGVPVSRFFATADAPVSAS